MINRRDREDLLKRLDLSGEFVWVLTPDLENLLDACDKLESDRLELETIIETMTVWLETNARIIRGILHNEELDTEIFGVEVYAKRRIRELIEDYRSRR